MRITPILHSLDSDGPKFELFEKGVKELFPGWAVECRLTETLTYKKEYLWILSIDLHKYSNPDGIIRSHHIQWDTPSIDESLSAHTMDEIKAAMEMN